MTLALKLPERLPIGFDLVSADAYLEITEATYTAIREQAGFKKADAHGGYGDEVSVAGTPLALRGSIGIHDYRANKDVAQVTKSGFFAHYTLELEAGIKVQKNAEGWDKLSDAVANALPKHTCRVRLQQFIPTGRVAPATSLPIPLGEAISGFTEIRGVRLAQPDPADPKKELYSVILQLTGDGGYGISTLTFIESRLDGDLLTRALNRLAEISGLAYKEVPAQ